MKLSQMIQSLQKTLREYGDKNVAFYESDNKRFGDFCQILFEDEHTGNEFWGFVSNADAKKISKEQMDTPRIII